MSDRFWSSMCVFASRVTAPVTCQTHIFQAFSSTRISTCLCIHCRRLTSSIRSHTRLHDPIIHVNDSSKSTNRFASTPVARRTLEFQVFCMPPRCGTHLDCDCRLFSMRTFGNQSKVAPVDRPCVGPRIQWNSCVCVD